MLFVVLKHQFDTSISQQTTSHLIDYKMQPLSNLPSGKW